MNPYVQPQLLSQALAGYGAQAGGGGLPRMYAGPAQAGVANWNDLARLRAGAVPGAAGQQGVAAPVQPGVGQGMASPMPQMPPGQLGSSGAPAVPSRGPMARPAPAGFMNQMQIPMYMR